MHLRKHTHRLREQHERRQHACPRTAAAASAPRAPVKYSPFAVNFVTYSIKQRSSVRRVSEGPRRRRRNHLVKHLRQLGFKLSYSRKASVQAHNLRISRLKNVDHGLRRRRGGDHCHACTHGAKKRHCCGRRHHYFAILSFNLLGQSSNGPLRELVLRRWARSSRSLRWRHRPPPWWCIVTFGARWQPPRRRRRRPALIILRRR
jgi:hypothetical protein